ncbi:MAG: SDR family oxidoreductase [Clostridia bacterium]|nr:SDR family oxidoreductase [Clostridia bacterium]
MPRTVLITGASGGIGRALCEAFLAIGDRVIAQYRSNPAPLTALQSRSGDRLAAVQADFCLPADVKALADFANRTGVDVLINNAGAAKLALFQSVSPDEAAALFAVNVESAMRLTQLILPHMLRQKHGRILNISSMWGTVGASCEVHYSATKSAIVGFTRALAKEVGPSGVTVNCIAPGFIDTPMNAALDASSRQKIIDDTPLCRAGTPEDIAPLAVFLASDSAGFITGQVIGVDGGLV